jgi:hypothetical protein
MGAEGWGPHPPLMRAGLGAVLAAVVSAGCHPTELSLDLIFPNAAARSAAAALQIAVVDDMTRSADCGAGLADGRAPPEAQPFAGLLVPPFDARIDGFRSAPQRLWVTGYDSAASGKNAILLGCTDPVDPSLNGRAEVTLEVVLPPLSALVKVSGDRLVGFGGEALTASVAVRLEGRWPEDPGPHPVPGYTVLLAPDPNLTIAGLTAGATLSTDSGVDGVVWAKLVLPAAAGRYQLAVSAPNAALSTSFLVSVVPKPTLKAAAAIDVPIAVDRAIGVAAGRVLDASEALVVLGCSADATGGDCAPGRDASGSPGAGRLFVVASPLGAAPRVIEASAPIERGPTGLFVGALSAAGLDQLAIVGRRASCSSSGCETSAIRIFAPPVFTAASRSFPITASNAVGLAAITLVGPAASGLVTAGQGRSVLGRHCSDAIVCSGFIDSGPDPFCTTPGKCGCPVGETCLCASLAGCSDGSGRCEANDQELDFLTRTSSGGPDDFYNERGCRSPMLSCTALDQPADACGCADAPWTSCTLEPTCGCRWPDRVRLTQGDIPYAVATGSFGAPGGVVAASVRGLTLRQRTLGGAYGQGFVRAVNTQIRGVLAPDLDEDGVDDLAWFAPVPCDATDNGCPRADHGGGPGCVGVALLRTDSQGIDWQPGDCRRYALSFAPESACAADLNGDGHLDLALSSGDSSTVAIAFGDGRGGLRWPPASIALPGNGGPIACQDLDGDGRPEVIVVGRDGGRIAVASP